VSHSRHACAFQNINISQCVTMMTYWHTTQTH